MGTAGRWPGVPKPKGGHWWRAGARGLGQGPQGRRTRSVFSESVRVLKITGTELSSGEYHFGAAADFVHPF